MAVPVIRGTKTESERFAGAEGHTIQALIGDRDGKTRLLTQREIEFSGSVNSAGRRSGAGTPAGAHPETPRGCLV